MRRGGELFGRVLLPRLVTCSVPRPAPPNAGHVGLVVGTRTIAIETPIGRETAHGGTAPGGAPQTVRRRRRSIRPDDPSPGASLHEVADVGDRRGIGVVVAARITPVGVSVKYIVRPSGLKQMLLETRQFGRSSRRRPRADEYW